MKRIVITFICAIASFAAQAKYIRFTVDMTDQVVNVAGVHLTGDFQALLGLAGGDWQSNTITMEQQVDTNMYSVLLNLPAFRKYEYKFVNGDQFYQVEFVPVESRVGYDFNDNRWLYLDSLNTDTTFIGALKFGENAPAGLQLMRYLVDMQQEEVGAAGVHVAGDFNAWNTTSNILYSFVPGIYEVITYAPSGVYTYNFLNGNTIDAVEVLSDICANEQGSRTIDLQTHMVLPTVCYASCAACIVISTGSEIKEMTLVYPNPTDGIVQFQVPDGHIKEAILMDGLGRTILQQNINGARQFSIDMRTTLHGLYFAKLVHFSGHVEMIKVQMQ